MGCTFRLLPIHVGLCAGLVVAPAASAQDLRQVQSLVFLAGTCEQLVVAGRDRSDGCRATAVNLNYRNGRTSFAFSDADGAMVSFSGIGEPARGDEGRLILDAISVAAHGGAGVNVDSRAATGSCEYSNPYAGRSYIRCTGETRSGEYRAAFTSNGEPPSVQRF